MEVTTVVILVGALLLFALFSLIIKMNALERNVACMNLMLNRVAKKLELPNPSLDDELRILIASGKKIPAIKELKKATGLGLKEAKDYVDKL